MLFYESEPRSSFEKGKKIENENARSKARRGNDAQTLFDELRTACILWFY
jgi:hypothetical protein